ncbi:MAG: 50S ribosomal protein L30 [Thermoplasmata archaeon]|nr:MAG: 50S ribosomal protein L30 [Thermoplasmata archaeon]HDO69017.1 50S ribosomal protein L30 [Thermoplasmatales archaeon]HEX16932.1 50S ribosomal protein L30 [Thermoplasmatales archaeon]
MVYAVIRVRGTVNVRHDIKKTLEMLRLNRVNHCVLVEESDSFKGMLQKAKDYITWGEIEKETLIELIKKRGRLLGDKPIDEDYLKKKTPFKSIEELAEAIIEGKIRYRDLPRIKPVFRLSPPRKGYEGIKRAYTVGGALGYRGKDINELIMRML